MRIWTRSRRKSLLAAVVVALVSAGAAAAAVLALGLHVTSQTSTRVTVAWTPDTGALGYLFTRDGVRVSNTWNSSMSSTTFSKPNSASHVYGVIPLYPQGAEYVTVPTGTPPPPTGATVYLSPSGSDSNACTQAAPCRTVQRGVTVASPGQVVELAAGDYSGTVTAQKAAPGVTVRIAATGNVTMSGFNCSRCAGVTLEGDAASPRRLSVRTFGSQGGARVTLRYAWLSWDGNQGNSYITDASDQVTLDRNEIGPVSNCGNFHVNTHINAASTNVRWTGNQFHDFTINSGCHSEAIWMAAVDGGELSNNTFTNVYGNTANVFFTTTDGGHCQGVSNFLISGNTFGATSSGSGYGLQFGSDSGCGNTHHHLTFRDNRWTGSQVVWATLTQPSSPGTTVAGECGSLSSGQHDYAVSRGVTFDRYPFPAC